MGTLKVGDRVKSGDGLLGRVSCFFDEFVGVVHDNRNEMFHNLGGECGSGYGWWYRSSSLTKVSVFKGNIK